MLTLHGVTFAHPGGNALFEDIRLTANPNDKIALIGNNGAGKSTLLKIISKELEPSSGSIHSIHAPYYIPQAFGQYNHLTVAEALGVQSKIEALKEILSGSTNEDDFTALDDDWTIEERCSEALSQWELEEIDLSQRMGTLSGGQKTRAFLAGIFIHQPELILLDEPSNHLDAEGRKLLYDFIASTKKTLIVVSHDRTLLNLLTTVCELRQNGIKVYGGNYDFYAAQKKAEELALEQDIQSREKALKKGKDKERETAERQQRLDNRGKAKQENAGVARIMLNTLRNSAENSTSRLKALHAEKTAGIARELNELRSSLPGTDKMKFGFADSPLHKGKMLFTATGLNHSHHTSPLWKEDLNFRIGSCERIAIKGHNGSGKSTLLRIILGELTPQTGMVVRSYTRAICIDQEYSLLDNRLTVSEQAQRFNSGALQDHEVKIRLNRFLFDRHTWEKSCGSLSGGERIRLLLCCLTIDGRAPEMIVLDEPTNNLDIRNTEILTAAISEYRGTLIVVAHDETFLKEIGVERVIELR